MKRIALAALAVVLLSGCRDEEPVSPSRPASGSQLDFLDGTVALGNPHFYFLSPVVKQPAVSGTANQSLRPMVTLCRLHGSSCATQVAQSRVGTGSPGLTPISVGSDSYQLDWDTQGTPGLALGDTVRIAIYTRGPIDASETTATIPQLGLADVILTSNGSARKRITDDYIALVDGRTLPIRFRIEQGAVAYASGDTDPCIDCVEVPVNTSAGPVTVTTPSGAAAAYFRQGAIPAGFGEVVVTINRIDTKGSTQPCLPSAMVAGGSTALDAQSEGCYDFSTSPALVDGDGGTVDFASPVTIGVCLADPEDVDDYDLYKHHGSDAFVTKVVNPSDNLQLNCSGFAPLASLEGWHSSTLGRLASAVTHGLSKAFLPTSLYATDRTLSGTISNFSRVGWARSLTLTKATGDGVTGAVVDASLQVQFGRTAHPDDLVPAVNVLVSWSVATGGGSVPVGSSLTDASGIATVPWSLGLGANTLIATMAGASPVTFTATGVDLSSSLSDATGDATSWTSGSGPDLASGTAEVKGGDLHLTVRYASSFDPASTATTWTLDTDLNPATGFPGIDAAHHDSGIMGTDYQLEVRATPAGNQLIVTRWASDGSSFTSTPTSVHVAVINDPAVTTAVVPIGYDVHVPLALLGASNGCMNYKVLTSVQLTSSSWTGILDYMQDVGASATSTCPVIL